MLTMVIFSPCTWNSGFCKVLSGSGSKQFLIVRIQQFSYYAAVLSQRTWQMKVLHSRGITKLWELSAHIPKTNFCPLTSLLNTLINLSQIVAASGKCNWFSKNLGEVTDGCRMPPLLICHLWQPASPHDWAALIIFKGLSSVYYSIEQATLAANRGRKTSGSIFSKCTFQKLCKISSGVTAFSFFKYCLVHLFCHLFSKQAGNFAIFCSACSPFS